MAVNQYELSTYVKTFKTVTGRRTKRFICRSPFDGFRA